MVNWINIIGIILLIVFLLIIGFIFGWFIGKLRFKRYCKRLDNEIHQPENVDTYVSLLKDQKISEITREADYNDRKRRLIAGRLGAGGSSTKPRTETYRREQPTERKDEQPVSKRGTGGYSELSDTETNERRKEDWSY